ncbi:hypothetical protein [Embleya sp. NPDC020630]|uniref:hypothetical protein n=1 Tax=Embleya sp. NPDC020630 TaxID=3363979 RepID=UPI003793E7D5
MSSPCDPLHAPVGDVGAALMMVDSRLKSIQGDRIDTDPEQQELTDRFVASVGPEGAAAVLDGACTLILLFMEWLRVAYAEHEMDAIERVVPNLVATLRRMPMSIRPEAIPTMAGLVVAAGTGLSPSLWRAQYGSWTEDEMTPLEATAFLLAAHINHLTDDPDFATRMVADTLSASDRD